MSQVRFAPFTTSVAVAFWTLLAKKKLTEWKLDDDKVDIWGYYEAGQRGRNPRFHITEECLLDDARNLSSR